MKKILAVIICVVLALGTMSMMGCGDATFNGNYKKASAETIEEFAENTENGNGFDLENNGFEMEMRIALKTSYEMMGVKMNIDGSSSANLKVAVKDGKVQAAGSSKTNSVSKVTGGESAGTTTTKEEAEFYYNEGYAYRKLKDTTGETKVKVQMDIETAIGNVLAGTSVSEESQVPNVFDKELFSSLIAEMGQVEGVKVLIDEEAKKAKIDLSGVVQGNIKISGAVYFAYDENYNLIAIKYDVKMDMGENNVMSIYFLLKGYDGAINLPSDLDTYQGD